MEKSLEELMKELDDIAMKLEKDDIKLDDAISNFENGVKIAKSCFEELKSTAGKISVLKKEMETLVEKPLEE